MRKVITVCDICGKTNNNYLHSVEIRLDLIRELQKPTTIKNKILIVDVCHQCSIDIKSAIEYLEYRDGIDLVRKVTMLGLANKQMDQDEQGC